MTQNRRQRDVKLKEQDSRERELTNNEWANKCAELKTN